MNNLHKFWKHARSINQIETVLYLSSHKWQARTAPSPKRWHRSFYELLLCVSLSRFSRPSWQNSASKQKKRHASKPQTSQTNANHSATLQVMWCSPDIWYAFYISAFQIEQSPTQQQQWSGERWNTIQRYTSKNLNTDPVGLWLTVAVYSQTYSNHASSC